MYYLLLTLLIIDGLVLAAVVLLQSGQGGGLAAMGGGVGTDNTLIGGRQAVTLLTKMSWITGGVFLGLSLLLSVISSRSQGGSVLRGQFQPQAPGAAAPAPSTTPSPAPATLPGTQTPANNAAPATTTTGQ